MIPPRALLGIVSPRGDGSALRMAASSRLPAHSKSNVNFEPLSEDFEDAIVKERRIARSLARLTSNEN